MLRRFLRSEAFPLFLLIAASLTIGLLTFRHYGESIDEESVYRYARHALSVYAGAFRNGFVSMPGDPVMDFYGPFYFVLALLGARLTGVLFPGQPVTDYWHLVYFLTFQAGLILFYLLARRWLRPWAALGATALMAFQPLLWGHAFINPKDIPFLVCFLACVVSGLRLADSLPGADETPTAKTPPPPRLRRIVLLAAAVWAILVLGLLGLRRVPLSRPAAAGLAALVILTGLALLTVVLVVYLRPDRKSLRQAAQILRNPRLWLTAALLGMTISFRLTGMLAALLVGGLMVSRRRAALPALIVCFALTALATYALWPLLWPAPLTNLLGAAWYMSHFPFHLPVLFNGQFYQADSLPFTYLPALMALQLSEPLLLLFVAGCLALGLTFRHGRKDLLLLVGLWFFLPLAGLVILRPPAYDNFRQYLFLLPPVFLLAGLSLDVLSERLRGAAWRALVLALCLLPGIRAGIRLHPYEYIYYNSLTGGVRGAAGRFETDYWTTAYRAAARQVNQVAPPGARIVVWGVNPAFARFARPDLHVFAFQTDYRPEDHYDYAVLTTRLNMDQVQFPEAPVTYRVEAAGVTLAVVKSLP